MDTVTKGFDAKAWNRERWALLTPWQRSEFRGEYRHARKVTGAEPYQIKGIINRAVSIATVYVGLDR